MTYGRAMHGMYAPVRTVAPASEPVSLAEAKAHLRELSDDFDTLISALIGAATEHLDGWSGVLGRALVTQTWVQSFDAFAERLRLPMPAASVVSVVYVDEDGQDQTLATENYVLRHDALGSYVELAFEAEWPTARDQKQAVTITFTCGSDASAVPAPIKAAILLLVGHLFENRDAVSPDNLTTVPMAVDALTAPYRKRVL